MNLSGKKIVFVSVLILIFSFSIFSQIINPYSEIFVSQLLKHKTSAALSPAFRQSNPASFYSSTKYSEGRQVRIISCKSITNNAITITIRNRNTSLSTFICLFIFIHLPEHRLLLIIHGSHATNRIIIKKPTRKINWSVFLEMDLSFSVILGKKMSTIYYLSIPHQEP